MTIIVNGEERPIDQPRALTALLADLGLGDTPVLVEHNGTALFQREFATTTVTDGDRIEIIRVVAGG